MPLADGDQKDPLPVCTEKQAFFYGPWSHCRLLKIKCPDGEAQATNTRCMRTDGE